VIQFQNVTFQYESAESPALSDISLTIEQGEFIAIVGHNGSGKSTLAKHINGLLLPSSGSVVVCGYDTKNENDLLLIRQRVGMAFQNPDNQLVTTVVEEDVAFGPENLGIAPDEIRLRVDDALAAVGMTAYAEAAVHTLSGGQKQRIAIAGILALHPDILVLDEATAMLDPSGRAELLETVKTLHNGGMTVIMVTQYMEETVDCDRIAVMNHGRIVAVGTPCEIFQKTEILTNSNLVAPEAVKVRNMLREMGLDIPDNVMTAERLAEAVCPLL